MSAKTSAKTSGITPMAPRDAWLYAASWGSAMTGGDPGACMYGFREDCRPYNEEHRQECLDWIDTKCAPLITKHPEWYDEDEAEKLASLRAYLVTAPLREE